TYSVVSSFFLLMLPHPPPSPLFPYTTLFRSARRTDCGAPVGRSGARLEVGPASSGLGGIDRGEHDGAGRLRRASTGPRDQAHARSEEHTSELQSRSDLVCRLLLEKKKYKNR